MPRLALGTMVTYNLLYIPHKSNSFYSNNFNEKGQLSEWVVSECDVIYIR